MGAQAPKATLMSPPPTPPPPPATSLGSLGGTTSDVEIDKLQQIQRA